ncbi:lipoyl(octanoyl) transferase LipB [Pelagibaculum spongiae]|uniref:Octanoyltransferase n=1 Tax=Pelagibaculum spongiae TaxID=2080658 RepID=A0A2V1GYD0_9GAMM|nr:lipoyl(octanoyl) transferase LipB [Pelagibaculum spongiae]PVZ72111.1 octanoyltransferase [Pelagibaculum spongiae]
MSQSIADTLQVRWLGRVDYQTTWQQMRDYTDNRDQNSPDQLWLLEHHPVFTQGQAGKAEHVLAAGDIPVVQTDRGGQVTYHGPGQLIGYFLIDLKRKNIGIRPLVTGIEQSLVEYLNQQGINAAADPNAPGVYIDGSKIASLGLRVRKFRSYHGLGLNVNTDLEPFLRINPCGYQGMQMTRMSDFGLTQSVEQAGTELAPVIAKLLDYTHIQWDK